MVKPASKFTRPSASPKPLPAQGESVATYRIFGEIGRGSQGVVYRALDTRGRRWVALKLPQPGAREAAIELRTEARLTGMFHHRNIVRSLGNGEHAGSPFLVLELLDGEDLANRIDFGGALPLGQALALAAGVARGLAAMHRRGLVHRDLKPGNIRVTARGCAKIFDLGVPGALRRRLPRGGFEYFGTPEYSSPEQCLCEEARIGPATDLYSLGVLLYEMISGRVPFTGEHTTKVLRDQVAARAVPIEELRPAVSPRLAHLLESLLEKEPAARPRKASAVALELELLAAAAAGCHGSPGMRVASA